MRQAEEYAAELPDSKVPRYLLVCDFSNFLLMDLVERTEHRFTLEELPGNIGLFGFIADKPRRELDVDPVIVSCIIPRPSTSHVAVT